MVRTESLRRPYWQRRQVSKSICVLITVEAGQVLASCCSTLRLKMFATNVPWGTKLGTEDATSAATSLPGSGAIERLVGEDVELLDDKHEVRGQ